jgi:hypothetical protein
MAKKKFVGVRPKDGDKMLFVFAADLVAII